MAFISANLNQDYEARAVAEGRYRLRVDKFDSAARSKAGNEGYKSVITILSTEDGGVVENPGQVHLWINKPNGGQYDNLAMRDLKRFLALFEVPFDGSGFDDEGVVGQEAVALLAQETIEGRDEPSNKIVLPPVRGEQETEEAPRRKTGASRRG